MRMKVVRLALLILFVGGASLGLAQQNPPTLPATAPPGTMSGRMQGKKPKEEKSKLEEMLGEALRNNPDIRVASAKLAEAEAELTRTRLMVTQKIVALQSEIAHHKAEVDYRQSQFERYRKLKENHAVEEKIVDEAYQKLVLAKAKLAAAEAELPYLLGKAHQLEHPMIIRDSKLSREALMYSASELVMNGFRARPPEPSGPMAERIRKALNTRVKVDYEGISLAGALKDLDEKAPGLSFRDRSGRGATRETLQFGETLPVYAVLQAMEDYFGVIFVVREYGILVTVAKQVPPGATTLQEFLRVQPEESERRK